MSISYLKITEHSPAYWRATFDNPPINLFAPETFAELRLLIDRLESDGRVRVVVFDSADDDYYIAHFDMDRGFDVPDMPGGVVFQRIGGQVGVSDVVARGVDVDREPAK